jgi:alkanesulfonate monooxygenase SsuD/methylene tetrahydromethanopterin reductase-like flavin-dependent oxidoreductase (luciferase family)
MYSRTPVATAQQAATIDEYSGGRMVLGIGVSHQVTVENWFGSRIEHPVAEMREYATALRAMFEGRDVPEGKRFPTKFRFMGFEPRADLPIYIAGLSPNMLRLAGEIADGVMLWLCNPEYIRSVVVPAVREGRERAGKTLDGFDVVAAVPAAVTDDRPAAYEVMRGDLLTYWSLPFYRAMIERSGFEEDIAAFDAAMGAGDIDKAKQAISDRFLDALTAIGSPDDVRAGVGRYRDAGATSPCVGPVPRTDFAATLEAAAP